MPHDDVRSPDLLIRPYQEPDEPGVTALWQEAFPDEPARNEPQVMIRRKLGVQGELFLVGERQGRIVGTVIAGYDGVRGWIYHMAVAKAEKRCGHGRALMADAEKRLAALGCPKVNLQVRSSNTEVVAFYRALGYAVEDRISMGKPLPERA
jgi:hypothetical protein